MQSITSKEPVKKIQKITGAAAVGAALVPVSHGGTIVQSPAVPDLPPVSFVPVSIHGTIVQSNLPGGELRSSPGTDINWDVDGDGTTDFRIVVTSVSSIAFFGFANDINAVVGPGFGKLDAGFTVGSTADFVRGNIPIVNTIGVLAVEPILGGWSSGGDDGYIGFQFDIAGGTHYGWAEATIRNGRLTISEAWYENVADASIDVAVPEVSQFSLGLGALAMGAAGLRRMRRQIA